MHITHTISIVLPNTWKEALRARVFPPIPKDARVPILSRTQPHSRAAVVLVDTRPRRHLELIVRDHARYVPGWDSVVFTCYQNRYVQEWCSHLVEIPAEWGNSYKRYQQLFCSPFLWRTLQDLGYEKCLCIQADTKLLRPGIEDFLEWDWVGAPWPRGTFDHMDNIFVGNGGLSLRSIPVMLEITERFPWAGFNEDVYFCRHLTELGKRIAPLAVAERFSCERIFKLGTLGYHAIERYFPPDQVETIRNQDAYAA